MVPPQRSPAPAERSAQPSLRGDRMPPHSEEAELGVLGAILLDAGRVLDLCAANRLTPEYFYLRNHQALFEVVKDMHDAGRHVDLVTVSQCLRDREQLAAIGGRAYLDQVIDATPTAAHAEYYLHILREKYLLRSMIHRARETIDACYDPTDDPNEILGQVEQSFFELAETGPSDVLAWDQRVKEAMAEIEVIFQTKKGLSGIPTGFRDFDRTLMGLKPGEMIILAARPSMGKTSLAMNVVENIATGYVGCTADYQEFGPAAVGVFSLEMSGEQLVRRMICCAARLPSHKLYGGYISGKHHGDLTQAASILHKARIELDDTPGLSAPELRSRARRMKRTHGIELLVIDYLQLLHYPKFAMEGRQRETAAISGALKAMAKELNLPVIVLSQLSRAPETRDRLAIPKLSDLRDSGSIEQDADVVLLLRRPCKYKDDPDAGDRTLSIVEIAKHRNGPTGEVRLNFEEQYTRFSDRAQERDGSGMSLSVAGGPGEFDTA